MKTKNILPINHNSGFVKSIVKTLIFLPIAVMSSELFCMMIIIMSGIYLVLNMKFDLKELIVSLIAAGITIQMNLPWTSRRWFFRLRRRVINF